MNSSFIIDQHLGFLQLNDAGEITSLEPVLLESLSEELKDWVGLPFEQWLHHTFSHVARCDARDDEETSMEVFEAGKTAEKPEYLFRVLGAHDGSTIQSSRLLDPVPGDAEPAPDEERVKGKMRLIAHWHSILSWLGPGFLHDTNNQLSGLVGLSECLVEMHRDNREWSERDQTNLKLVLQSGSDALLILQLMTRVYNLEPKRKQYADLRDLLGEAARLIDTALPISVNVRLETGDKALPVYLDPFIFFQLVLGLVSTWFPRRYPGTATSMCLKATTVSSELIPSGKSFGNPMCHSHICVEFTFGEELLERMRGLEGSAFLEFVLPDLISQTQSCLSQSQSTATWLLGLPLASVDH
ncbi:hypothetical protein OAK97_02015 [bacterium]|nr:hypothetical protein [bacterium]MDG1891478.1 hypothetical protein [Verrucomicrobiota bacterium]